MLLSETPKSNTLFPKRSLSRLFFSHSKTLSPTYSLPSSETLAFSPTYMFSPNTIEENIESAESIITKWDMNSKNTTVTFLFQNNRKEANEFIKLVHELRRAMQFLVHESYASSKLVLAQKLMQTAMKRLDKELYEILSTNRDELDPASVSNMFSVGSSKFDEENEDEIRSEKERNTLGNSIKVVERVSELAMTDLKSIANCMIISGYGKECVKTYNIMRKSIIDEGLYSLGVKRFRSSQIHKMGHEALAELIKNWSNAAKVAVKTIFCGERILCDHIFSASETIRESCFYEITKEGATNLLRFPQVISKSKKSSERIFQLMELHETVSALYPKIESIFNSESTSAIRLQAILSKEKLKDSVQFLISDYESTIHKDSYKTPILGGGIHPLTRSAIDYISSLAEHNETLSCILHDYPLPGNLEFQESYFQGPISDDNSMQAVSVRLAWLILVLICKLDSKAELYRDVSLSYLFLANNLQFILDKVCKSNLKFLLGNEWISTHSSKVQLYALNYESAAWTKVFSSLPDNIYSPQSIEMVKECFRRFNAALEEEYRKQTSWLVEDGKLRNELKVSIANKLVPKYKAFYDANVTILRGEKNLEFLVKFSPDDLGNYLSDLFHGTSSSGSSTSSHSSLPSHGCLSH